MRLAIVADVHGSLAALEAVVDDLRVQAPDLVVHGGDLAVNGPRPAEVVDLVRDLGWPGVVGNTDEILWDTSRRDALEAGAPKLKPLLRVLFDHTGPATAERLGEERIDWLRALPERFAHSDVVLTHASPNDLWRAPAPDGSDDDLDATYRPLGARVAVYGHIHRAYVRYVNGLVVANTGSAGLSWDGDTRASYLLIDDGEVSLRRVAYDVERDVADLFATDYPFAEWLATVRRTARYSPPT